MYVVEFYTMFIPRVEVILILKMNGAVCIWYTVLEATIISTYLVYE